MHDRKRTPIGCGSAVTCVMTVCWCFSSSSSGCTTGNENGLTVFDSRSSEELETPRTRQSGSLQAWWLYSPRSSAIMGGTGLEEGEVERLIEEVEGAGRSRRERDAVDHKGRGHRLCGMHRSL